MEFEQTNRRLAAILAADVVGYSRLMASDESGTLAALKRHRENEFDPVVTRHKGRIVKLMGDGTLVEFTSVVDAVSCAVEIQQTVAQTADTNIVLRIGINLGDIIVDGDDIYGNGVNIAARLEPLAKPGGICVSSIVNESVAERVDIIFENGGNIQVKNIDRPINIWHWHPDVASSAGGRPIIAMASKERTTSEALSIAVLPFENMSGIADQEYFSDGISEDIITDLSKLSGLLVIARNSSFAYKGRSMDLRTIGQELGVGTVLEGSVRKAGNRVRITAQLIDAATGGHLWAERYDRELTDIFAVQDEVTLSIVDALKVTLAPGEREKISGAGTSNLEAHDCLLRARAFLTSPNLDAEVYRRVTEFAGRAIELDRGYAQAYAVLALAHVFDYFNNWSDDGATAMSEAAKLADRALELAPNDQMALLATSTTSRFMGDNQRATKAIEKALSLNPNSANSLFARGELAISESRPRDAIPDIELALRLDPAYSHHYLHYLGVANLLLGNDETAALIFRERLVLAKDTDISRAMLASALGHLGEVEESRKVWKRLMKINPHFSIQERLTRLAFTDPSGGDRIVDGLTKSGLPE